MVRDSFFVLVGGGVDLTHQDEEDKVVGVFSTYADAQAHGDVVITAHPDLWFRLERRRQWIPDSIDLISPPPELL